jgi:hypothetical protein
VNKVLLVVALVVTGLAVAAAAKNVPDVNRYRKIRAM